MSRNKLVLLILAVVTVIIGLVFFNRGAKDKYDMIKTEINPYIGDIRITVSTTGVIEPQNRLEIKPSINGRIEEILVNEGDKVKKGDILAYMSSTERAALVDAAGSKNEATREYWEEVYKQTPIISPIDGEVIVRPVEPGQTVTASDDVLVLSDRLIVSAQFDETDIGKIAVGQKSIITLDAYPDVSIKGVVDHIAYESELVNNVNIYDVDVLPQQVPDFFRSGMSANVEVIQQEREGVLLIPVEALIKDQDKTYVLVKKNSGKTAEKRQIETGLTDEKNAEVLSGISIGDTIIIQSQNYSPVKKEIGANPFMPFRRK